MKSGKLASLLCLIVTMSGLCRAELLPGDIALTRIQGDVISLMALRAIPDTETIIVTDRNWANGQFEGPGGIGAISIPDGGLQPGKQRIVNLAGLGIDLNWDKTLHFVQQVSPAHTSDTFIRHLLVVELRRDGLRWMSDIPNGLIRDVTHIVLREQFEGQGMDHIIKEGLLTAKLTPLKWMRALGSFRAWTRSQEYPSPPTPSQWLELNMTVNPSPGIISLPYKAQNFAIQDGQIYVPVRRSFGSTGNAAVALRAIDKFGPFKRWRNETISGLNMDFTDVAFGPGIGFVAVAPKSGLLLLNEEGNWSPKETNGNPALNLELTSITHDGDAFWACSLKGGIYKSGNGIDWDEVREGKEGERLFGIQFINNAEFPYFSVGANGLALISTDGANWGPVELASNADFYGAAFFAGRYVLCGSEGTIISAADPTKPWSPSLTPGSDTLYALTAIDAGGTPTLLAVGQYGAMISSSSLETFTPRQSNTSQSLFDVIQVLRNGGEDKYLFAVGANGATVVSVNGSEFKTPRFDPRAPALYALAQDNTGAEPIVYGVGEYGSLTRFDTDGATLSGSVTGLSLDGNGSSVDLTWDTGDSSEKYVKLTKGVSLTQFRERILLNLERPSEPGVAYRVGNDESEINFFRSININTPPVAVTPVASNFGPLLNLTGAQLEVLSDEEWRLRFRIINTSRRPSQRLFIRFEGTNLPDFDIPPGDTQGADSTLKPLERTDFIGMTLRQPVETIALYEEFRSGEVVLKARTAINSLVANPNWEPNGIFERSLGAYLLDVTGLNDPGIPGIGILGGGQGAGDESAPAAEKEPVLEEAAEPAAAGGSGFVFSGSAPTPPDNNPEAAELVLLDVNIDDSLISMDVRETYDFFMVGTFYNTGTGLTEEYAMNTVDWDVTESSLPATGLSIEDDSGTLEAAAYPGAAYPRALSIDATTTEGAPTDDKGEPVEYSDSQGLSITEPASYTTFAEWVTANSLTGDDALQGADPDGDSIVNLLEFILGTDPNVANTMSAISSSYDALRGEFTFSFTVPKELSAVTMKILTSEDLDTWTERAATLTGSDSTTETWSATVTMGSCGFGTLQVETYTPTP